MQKSQNPNQSRGVGHMAGSCRVFPAPPPNAPPVVSLKTFSSSPIVEKMMLNCSGCATLQDIVNLDLSNRRISTLDPSVFSRMSILEELNIENNRLTGFPLSLGLRKLKKLNCNNNQLKSVHTLEQFPNLEELNIENNELTVADQYIAVYMLPKLKVLNGKEVDLRETILNMEETLQEQVHILWAESCAPLLKDPMSKAEIQMLEQQFIELLKSQVQFGPEALTDFTHHMLSVLAEKCVRQMTAHLRKIAEPGTPISKVQIVVRNDTASGNKSMNNGAHSIAQQVKALEKRQLAEQNDSQEPATKKIKGAPNSTAKTAKTPKTPKTPKTTAKRKMIEAQRNSGKGKLDGPPVLEEIKTEPIEEIEGNQECGIAYEPVHLLRCHSVDNDPTDAKTNVWKCAFEPNAEIPGASKWTVATCGSNQVCVIDCNSGKVLKKYQHVKEKEEFYCIAWTKLHMILDTKKKNTTVLAAAGIRGSIKLLHTTQLLCYAEFRCDRRARPINCLQFHPKKPNWLFCGSEDISVYDIGIPHGPDLKCKHKKLMTLEAPGRVLGLVICPKSNFLMAGCDNGCYGWSLDLKGGKREKEHSVEFLLPSKARLLGDEEEEEDEEEKEGDMIDGLALLKDDLIASKVACDGSIHVWSLSQARAIKSETGKDVTISPLYTLEWCDSDSVYLDIGTWPGCGVLVSGDDQGEVWVYDVSKVPSTKSKKPVKPSQLLPWPENRDQEMEEVKEEEGTEKTTDAATADAKENNDKTESEQQPTNDSAQKQDNTEASQSEARAQSDEIMEQQTTEGKDAEKQSVEGEIPAVELSSEDVVAQVVEEVVSQAVKESLASEVTVVDEEKTTENQANSSVQGEVTEVVVQEKEGEEKGEGGQEEKKEESAEKQKEASTEVQEEQSTEIQKEGSTETQREGSTETQKEGSTETQKEGSKETQKEGSTETQREGSTEEQSQGKNVGEQEDKAEENQGEKDDEKQEENNEGKAGEESTEKTTEENKEASQENREEGEKVIEVEIKEEPQEVQEEPPKKRGRGRPRKYPRPEAAPKPAEKPLTPAQKAKLQKEQKAKELAAAKKEQKAKEMAAAREKRVRAAAKAKAEKAEKKAKEAALAAKAKAEKAEQRAKEIALAKERKAELKAEKAELRALLKPKGKKKDGVDDVMEIANNEDRIIVNDVAISSDCKFIVSVTNKNLICIWQRV